MNPPDSDPDVRYARGEISREEWQRTRATTPPMTPPGSSPTAPRPSTRAATLLIVLVVAVAATAAFLLVLAGSPGLAGAPTYASVKQLQAADLEALNASATRATAFAANNTLWFPRGAVRMVVYASPPDHDLAFVVQGLANPSIHVPSGDAVTLTVVNVDAGEYHAWALSRNGPPYSSMPMMNSGMMTQMAMLAPSSTSGFWSQQLSFAPTAGSLWYLCPVADHASGGMYGAFTVM